MDIFAKSVIVGNMLGESEGKPMGTPVGNQMDFGIIQGN